MKHLLLTTIAAVLLVGCGNLDRALIDAARDGNIALVRRELSRGADVNAKDSDGFTVLHLAVANNHKNIAELLIAKGADVNAKLVDASTALHYATGNGHKEIAELLIANGADVNAKRKKGGTPLHQAAISGHKEIVELLIAKGADVNTMVVSGDHKGRTPLDVATLRERFLSENETLRNPDNPNASAETADLLRKHGGKTGVELKAEGK